MSHDDLVKRLRKTSVLDHPMDARHAMDIASLALQHADTRAAEDRALILMLQKALAYWMPSVFDERSAQDAYLLVGYEGPDEAECWGDMVKADAERYQYLKRNTRTFSLDMGGQHRYDPSRAFRFLAGPSLDDAFDAAIAKDKA